MSDALVSVVVPSHDHGPTLRPAVRSALAQTHSQLELLIVGDGMPAAAADVARELEREHERVRLFEFEKGERHGEAHRHTVLCSEARGDLVLYLSDDDLWLPDHVERVVAALAEADLVGATVVKIDPDGSLAVHPHDLSSAVTAELMLSDARPYNRVPLSVIAHTMAAYRRHPGWAPAPEGLWTDLNFLRGFVADDSMRRASVTEVTCLSFPSPQRRSVELEQRAAESEAWLRRIEDPAGLEQVRAELEAAYRNAFVELDFAYQQVYHQLEVARARIADLEPELGARERLVAAEAELIAMRGTLRWRAGGVLDRPRRALRSLRRGHAER